MRSSEIIKAMTDTIAERGRCRGWYTHLDEVCPIGAWALVINSNFYLNFYHIYGFGYRDSKEAQYIQDQLNKKNKVRQYTIASFNDSLSVGDLALFILLEQAAYAAELAGD